MIITALQLTRPADSLLGVRSLPARAGLLSGVVRRLNARQFASHGQTHKAFLVPLTSPGTDARLMVASRSGLCRLGG
jgi:hypothetical protein